MVKLDKIYTRGGDKGMTSLGNGSRLAKQSSRICAIGDVDEANSTIGFARLAAEEIGAHMTGALSRIQNDLFDLGADLDTPAESEDDFEPSDMVLRIVPSQVERLEARIDAATAALDPLTSFILPGGATAAAAVHLVRAVARRTERTCVAAGQEMALNPQALAYINRLSDYLFVLGRKLNNGGKDDILWVPGGSR